MRARYMPVLVLALVASLTGVMPATAQTPEVTPTSQAELRYTWDLQAIYPDAEAWQKDFDMVASTYLPRYAGYQGRLGDAEALLEYLQLSERASRLMDKLYVYAGLTSDEDQTDSQASERLARAESLQVRLDEAAAFVTPELLALPDTTLRAYTQNERFKTYWHMLDAIIRQKAHTLSQAEEALLAAAGEMANAPETIYTKITEADMQFPVIQDSSGADIQLGEDVYYQLLLDPDRDLRRRAFEGVLGSYNAARYSLAAALDAQMRKDSFYARARQYGSSLEASLDANTIPVSVYTSLVEAANARLDVLHHYVALRQKVLHLDSVHHYDMYTPLVGEISVTMPYDEATSRLAQALAPLGSDYLGRLQGGFNGRWIDVYPKDNKLSGAYSWGAYDTHPYVLLNYDETLDSMLTLAHEMGHALNAALSNETQAYVNCENPIFLAEIASTTNELLTLRYLLNQASDDNERLFYLNQQAETIRTTFFSQVMYAEFEQQLHERIEQGDALSVDSLNQLWGDLQIKYLGPSYQLDELGRVGWARIPHFYYNFYVYQYATGIAAANQFVANITSGQSGAVEAYLTFLKAGSSDYPVDLLKQAGVDMTTGAPVDNLLTEFERTITQMEDILRGQGKL